MVAKAIVLERRRRSRSGVHTMLSQANWANEEGVMRISSSDHPPSSFLAEEC